MQYGNLGYGLNPIKPEPLDRGPSPYQVASSSGIPVGGFSPVYRVDRGSPSPQPAATLQPYRQQLSPGRTPSPMEYLPQVGANQYNILPTQHLHQQQQQQQQMQQQQQQQHHQFNIPPQFHSAQQHQYALQQQMMLNRVNTEQTGSVYLPLVTPDMQNTLEGNMEEVGGVSSMLNLDNNSLHQLDSTDLASFTVYDENLPQSFSSNLSLSDIKVSQETIRTTGVQEATGVAGGNGNNMTDSFTRLTTNTIQELCTLNNMFLPTRDNTGLPD